MIIKKVTTSTGMKKNTHKAPVARHLLATQPSQKNNSQTNQCNNQSLPVLAHPTMKSLQACRQVPIQKTRRASHVAHLDTSDLQSQDSTSFEV